MFQRCVETTLDNLIINGVSKIYDEIRSGYSGPERTLKERLIVVGLQRQGKRYVPAMINSGTPPKTNMESENTPKGKGETSTNH